MTSMLKYRVFRKLKNIAPFHVRKQLAESLILSKLDWYSNFPIRNYQIERSQRFQFTAAGFIIER